MALLVGLAEISYADIASPDTLSDRSLYQFDATWTNQHGKEVKLLDLQGRSLLVAMIYADCKTACPVIVHKMKKVGEQLEAAGVTNFGYLLVSINPEEDAADVLHHFSEMNKLPAEDWTLLRGKETDTRTLATLLGVRYKQESNGQFSHSNTITLLSEGGEILYQQERLDAKPAVTAEAIQVHLADS